MINKVGVVSIAGDHLRVGGHRAGDGGEHPIAPPAIERNARARPSTLYVCAGAPQPSTPIPAAVSAVNSPIVVVTRRCNG